MHYVNDIKREQISESETFLFNVYMYIICAKFRCVLDLAATIKNM